MKVDVQEISSVKRAIRIEVPEEVVSSETHQAYRDLNRRVRWPGFRKGKTPITLLEKRYADTVREDVLKKLIPDYYRRALEQTGIRPVDYPAFEKIEIEKDTPLSFTALVEIKPSIELESYDGIRLERADRPVSDEEIDGTIEHLRRSHAQMEAAPDDHPVAAGDVAIIDFEGKVDGEPFEGGKAENYLLELGSGRLLPGVEEGLIGKRRGERCAVETPFPDDHGNPRLAGKTAVLDVTIREVKIKRLPAADDEFAKDLGPFQSMGELRAKIGEDLQSHHQREARRSYHEAVIKDLMARHAFEVPASLVEREVVAMGQEMERRIRQLGRAVKEMDYDTEALHREFEPRARDHVSARLILEAIAEREKVEASDEEMEAEFDRLAAAAGVSKEEFKKVIVRQEESLAGIRARLREDKVLDLIVSRAQIVEREK